jgi:S1-C subfamily serine protease
MFTLVLCTGVAMAGCQEQTVPSAHVVATAVQDSNATGEAFPANETAETTLSPRSTIEPDQSVANEMERLTEAIKRSEQLDFQFANLVHEYEKVGMELSTAILASTDTVNVDITQLDILKQQSSNVHGENQFSSFLHSEITRINFEVQTIDQADNSISDEFAVSGFPESQINITLELAQRLRRSVLIIDKPSGGGTGFVVGPNLVVTNEHVVGTESSVTIRTINGEEFSGTVLGKDGFWDVALIRAPDLGNIPALSWGRGSELVTGDPVFSIGHPGRMGYWAVVGGLHAFTETYDPSLEGFDGNSREKTTLYSTLPGFSGASGSPIFNSAGEVVGILWGAVFMRQGQHGGIPKLRLEDPAPNRLHSRSVVVPREWTTGTPAEKVRDLIDEWLR